MSLSGGLGEAEKGGIYLNVIPKTGGNMFKGELFGSAAGSWSQGNNLDATLQSYGIQNPRDDSQQLRHERRDRRSDQEGQALVLRQHPLLRSGAGHPGFVRERQRRRPERVDVRRESGRSRIETRAARASTPAGSPGRPRRRNKFSFYEDHQTQLQPGVVSDDQRRRLPRRRCQLARDRIVRRRSSRPRPSPPTIPEPQNVCAGARGRSTVTSKLLLEAGVLELREPVGLDGASRARSRTSRRSRSSRRSWCSAASTTTSTTTSRRTSGARRRRTSPARTA